MASKPNDVPTPAAPTHSSPIALDEPIKRGETTIDSIVLRKPKSGELRGVSLVDLAQLDVAALQRVIPRVSQPTLTEHEVSNLDPADLMVIGAELVGTFFQRKADRSPA